MDGIYVSPCVNRPNTERECVCEDAVKEDKLWIIEYEVRSKITKGCAVVKAPDPNTAQQILKSSGFFNGTPELYSINRIEEIIIPPLCGLVAEQFVTYGI